MRFRAPPRESVDRAVFGHPVFAGVVTWRDWLSGKDWPDIDVLNGALRAHMTGAGGLDSSPQGGALQFVPQRAELLADGRHYEQRIAETGRIATREANWHDLLNALIWLRYPQIKRAMHGRQVADMARVGAKQRTRAQDALTQFDEAGVIVSIDATADVEGLIQAWNRHAWGALFELMARSAWRIDVIGHALLEHALEPERLLVGKAVVVVNDRLSRAESGLCSESGERVSRRAPTGHESDLKGEGCIGRGDSEAVAQVAQDIDRGALLNDPQELRPLPLMGLPGWHPRAGDPAFYADAECFQPVRAGRRYPSPRFAASPGTAAARTREKGQHAR
ncbi:MAG: DUF3025 domain-containing protein [Xanthomonadales bacterium]|nr:DUF3025 domain-containing protein [Xanthomonadales bacterium]